MRRRWPWDDAAFFFIADPQPPQRMANPFLAHAQPPRALGLVRVRMFPNVLRQSLHVNLCGRLVARARRFNLPDPAYDAGHAYAKPLRHLGNCKVFLLPHR